MTKVKVTTRRNVVKKHFENSDVTMKSFIWKISNLTVFF